MSINILAFDPGLEGGLAALKDGNLVYWAGIPSQEETVNGKNRRRYLEYELVHEVKMAIANLDIKPGESMTAYVELVHSLPKQGVTSSFTFGVGFGIIKGILAALTIPTEYVTPQEWKKDMLAGKGKAKGNSIIRAQQIYPKLVKPKEKLKDGIAEAVLIAVYGYKKEKGGFINDNLIEKAAFEPTIIDLGA